MSTATNTHFADALSSSSDVGRDSVPSALPHWDMSVVFPSLESDEFQAAFANVTQQIVDLSVFWDANHISDVPPSADAKVEASTIERVARVFDEMVARYSRLGDDLRTVRGYISAHISTNSKDESAQARSSELQQHLVVLSKLGTRMTAWIGTLDIPELRKHSETAREHGHYLRRTRYSAEHLMPTVEEGLYSELYQAGGGAWSKLYSNTISQIAVPFGDETLPMSAIRALASEADRDVRKRAFEAELAAWEANALPLAAAMNAIKHETNVICARRGWESPLDLSIFGNSIDKMTLDALLSAARKSFPDFRRYFQAKARVVAGTERLAWYDLFAPVQLGAGEPRRWEWHEAEVFIAQQFGTYSPKMQALALRAFREKWIDAEPRMGKHDGAFCMGIRGDESRIGQNYRPAYNGVSTLAHELGHAYHNLCLAERPYLQRGTPMTLAETASIFCETIVRRAAMNEGSETEQIAILEASLQGAGQLVVDITSRFLFERSVLKRRSEREISIRELCDLMTEAQSVTYGDGLDSEILHPYMWAAKGHYYGSSFYNYPYMFGLLFALGLFAKYERDPDRFRARYDDLLSRTGMADAWDLAARWDVDIHDEWFWAASLDVIRADIDRFVALTATARADV